MLSYLDPTTEAYDLSPYELSRFYETGLHYMDMTRRLVEANCVLSRRLIVLLS